jgi:hypothetical protein
MYQNRIACIAHRLTLVNTVLVADDFPELGSDLWWTGPGRQRLRLLQNIGKCSSPGYHIDCLRLRCAVHMQN